VAWLIVIGGVIIVIGAVLLLGRGSADDPDDGELYGNPVARFEGWLRRR